jgi:hypothetical protein
MLTPKVQVNNIDFNTLTKGDKIKVNVIEERYGIKQDQAIYALALTMLRQEIEKSLKAREYPVTTKGVDGNIHILTDAEATYELHSRTTKRLKGIGRDHNQMQSFIFLHLGKSFHGKTRCLNRNSNLFNFTSLRIRSD